MRIVICHGCGRQVHIRDNDVAFFCSVCGACNDVPRETSSDRVLNCLAPDSFEWPMPSGMIKPAIGEELYKDSRGNQFNREDFKRIYKCDPKIALENMRKLGKEGTPGAINTSTLGRRKA